MRTFGSFLCIALAVAPTDRLSNVFRCGWQRVPPVKGGFLFVKILVFAAFYLIKE